LYWSNALFSVMHCAASTGKDTIKVIHAAAKMRRIAGPPNNHFNLKSTKPAPIGKRKRAAG
jgi:hypothetical protein